jgi:hypothetical protein
LRDRKRVLIIVRQTASAATSQKKEDYAILIVDMPLKIVQRLCKLLHKIAQSS